MSWGCKEFNQLMGQFSLFGVIKFMNPKCPLHGAFEVASDVILLV